MKHEYTLTAEMVQSEVANRRAQVRVVQATWSGVQRMLLRGVRWTKITANSDFDCLR